MSNVKININKALRKHQNIFLFAAAIIFASGILIYAYHGIYVRFMADDFCIKHLLRDTGFINTYIFYFLNLISRYSTILLNILMVYPGEKFSHYLPAFYIGSWFLSLYWLLWEIFKLEGKPKVLPILLISELIIYFTLRSASNLYQIFYMVSGGISYIFTYILISLLGAVILYFYRKPFKNKQFKIMIIFLVSLFIGGLAEIPTIIMTCILSISILLVWLTHNPKIKKINYFFIASLVAFIISGIILLTGPGNQIRYSEYSHNLHVYKLIASSFHYLISYFEVSFFRNWPEWSIVMTFSTFIGLNYWSKKIILKNVVKIAFLTIFSLFIISFLTISIYFYATNTPPIGRVLFYSDYFVIISLSILGFLIGIFIKQNEIGYSNAYSNIMLGIFLIFVLFIKTGPLMTTINYVRGTDYSKYAFNRKDIQAFNETWDRRIDQLKNSQEKNVVSFSILNPYAITELSEDPYFWVNQCMSKYFNLNSITIK